MDAADRSAWQHADRLFAELIELDAQERARRLESLTAPEAVREHLLRMLASTRKQTWLDHEDPVLSATATPARGLEPVPMRGRRLGHWEIGEELGRGGMAVVYRARRVDGAVNQEVALKVLTVASLSRHGAESFRGETRILARLRHPHIVGLLDTGITDDGTPWLAMPLVDGVHISRWCDEHALDTRATVHLFLQVAGAVASAHRSLVIHRDIKPSNVLVDAEGQVHLLDFGIGRLLNEVDHATVTQWRALTPGYAAPEQHSGESVTTAVDVHGLGALLYRLLTGQPPRGADSADITLPSQAAARQAQASSRHRLALLKDLDPVLMKALAADPANRYASVDAFSADLQRWLHGKPVLATPPSRSYRLRKFISRHRLGVAATSGLLVLLLAGVAATLWQARRAQFEAERAVAVKGLLVDILQSADPTRTGGADPPASDLLRLGADRVHSQLADRPLLQAEMLLLIGRAQLARGFLEQSKVSLDSALALYAEGLVDADLLAQTQTDRAMLDYELGDNGAAVQRLREADRSSANAAQPLRWKIRAHLADQLLVAREFDEAHTVASELIQSMRSMGETASDTYFFALRSLGAVKSARGEHAQAIDLLLQSERGLLQYHAKSDLLASTRNELGLAYLAVGKQDLAEQAWSAALEQQQRMYGEAHAITLTTRVNLAGLHLQQGGAAEAVTEFERILEIEQTIHDDRPHPQIVSDFGWLAMAHYQSGSIDKAIGIVQSAQQMVDQLPESERATLAWVNRLKGLLHFELGKEDAAALLGDVSDRCRDLDGMSLGSRWGCLAGLLLAAEAGRCQVPKLESDLDAESTAIEHRWMAVYELLRALCGEPAQREAAAHALAKLTADEKPPFPGWLEQRIRALNVPQ
ncbi:MAG: tetratricopeptide repeat protein [Elusimicrobia bacterium]|nr:MAG: tetratricopeptide repeat protein [Gammaproteobacteria bacterium]TXH25743.1 MAG: tetratricopeptide repeat protein [Elusimicrobiota bacterium]